MTEHYIITRYNLCIYRHFAKRAGGAEEWMKERFEMFKKYCVPSVQAQTCKDFTWMLLFDSQTPTEYIKNIKKLLSGLTYVILCIDTKSRKFKEGDSFWIEYVKGMLPCEIAMMTRLDCDDSIDKYFVEMLQSFVVPKPIEHGYVLDYQHGFMYDVNDKKLYLARHERIGSPFITLVEKVGKNMGTVYWSSHSKVASHFFLKHNYFVVSDEPMWIMNIHGKNCTNRIFEDMIVGKGNYTKVRGRFGINSKHS